ncbi:HDOD domain-containing protein [Bythopirellula polymerisocia]|uniref:HDOD domain protein n=1 Tax=Bythopirellula polymerisocia TaxID=2528003 RepID=A0A5C6CV43_9BACT|nr:HDOD domain-containing protein [Bythopirellula polymerisocia]TWU27377.1 HDOD domain protein [Bythopirellula polymerisocia]
MTLLTETVLTDDGTAAIDQLLGRLNKLHSSPAVALQVMDITRDPDFEFADVKRCLENDPALTAAVLRLVNSSYYGLSRKITAVQEAMAYLGRRSLRLSVLSFGLVKALANGCPKAFHENYWRRSLSMAVAARKLAERCDEREVHADSVFAAGLLADLGMMALAQLETSRYLETCTDCDHLVEQMNREREEFGFTHVDVGVRLLAKWQLPEELIEAVSEHHRCPATAGKMSQILKAASVLAEVFWTTDCPHMRILLPMLKTRFDLDVDDLITLATECKDAVKESVEVFQVRIDGEIDIYAIQREAQAIYEAAVLETAVDLDSLEGLLATGNGQR